MQETVTKKSKALKTLREYIILTIATLPSVVGIYFFKFPNNFTFAGVTGISVVLSKIFMPVLGWLPATYNTIFNVILLALGFLILGKGFGVKTVYVTMLTALLMNLLEKVIPVTESVSGYPTLDLVFAIVLPAISTAIVVYMGASCGGTEIVAMIIKKFKPDAGVGTLLLVVDSLVTLSSYFVFGLVTGLFSTVGLLAKCLIVNRIMDSIGLCKYFTIVCDKAEPICDFIDKELKRSSTIINNAEGAHTHNHKDVVLTVMNRQEAAKLRLFIKKVQPDSFMMITNSSEIVGREFKVYNY